MAGDTRFILNKGVMVVYCWCIYKQADNLIENFLFFLIKPLGYPRDETKKSIRRGESFHCKYASKF